MTQEIPILDIIPPDSNYSYDKEELERLKSSIEVNGMFHPIILQELAIHEVYDDKHSAMMHDPEENPDSEPFEPPYRIIAGRARYLATVLLGKITISATILPSSCKNPHEVSLHENLRRHNLPWYEQVEYEKELHELRISQHGGKVGYTRGRPRSGEEKTWTLRDTANELGMSLGTVSEDLNLALELQRNPNLRNVKDKETAKKLIKNITKRSIAEVEQAMPSEISMDEVLLGDSATLLKSFPEKIFDACITDPPWSEYKDEELRSDQIKLLPIFLELFRVLKRDAFLIVVTSSTDFYFYHKELPKLGFKVQSYPIIWWKTKTITHGRASWQFARDYEPIIIAVKGDPSLTVGTELSSIMKYDNVHYSKMIHPHEKPIGLVSELIRVTTHAGAKVIDPFAGSGVTLEACKKLDRRFIGLEKEKKFYDQIVRRLGEKE